MTFDGEASKRAITAEWSSAAAGWHRRIPTINDWLSDATEAMLDHADVQTGHRVLDVAAGDGGQSVSAARRVGSSGEVLATDIAPEFVELANAVATRLELPPLRSEVMDGESLTVADSSYDAVISRLGLMYLPNLAVALAEVKRVLRPGGRVAAVVFTTPEQTPFFSIPVRLIPEGRGIRPPEPGRPGPFALVVPVCSQGSSRP